MSPASRSPRRRAIALALAGLACLAQSLGGFLPEPVVCLRNDRPARAELFTRCCSCQHEDPDLGQPAVPAGCIEPGCVDVPLASPALAAARHYGRRCQPAPLPAGVPLLPMAFAVPAGWPLHGRGSPPRGIPLPPTRLRC